MSHTAHAAANTYTANSIQAATACADGRWDRPFAERPARNRRCGPREVRVDMMGLAFGLDFGWIDKFDCRGVASTRPLAI